jgi:hypothetical protein
MATMRADFQNKHPSSELSVKVWRRSMISYGLMAKNFELLFAHTLANKLLKKLMMKVSDRELIVGSIVTN